MKHISRTLTLFCTLCLLVFTKSLADNELVINNERMHNIVKAMLDFKENPHTLAAQNSAEDAPKFMLDLYERYQNRPITRGHRVGNTVRSIKATKEYVTKEEMYVFNLSSLSSTEEIISAEIHLYKNKKTKFNKHANLELVLHEIASLFTLEIGSVSVKKELFGWQWFDVTDSVKKCIIDRQNDLPSLGLNFKVIKPHGNSNALHLKRYINEHSTPYLIIYSIESQNIDLDELEKLSERSKEQEVATSSQIDNKKDVDLPVTDITLPVRTKRNKRSISDNGVGMPAYQSQARSLSLLTNEIPEYPDDYNRLYPIHVKTIQTHPAMLQTRKVSRHRLVDSKLIPYPGEYIDKRRKSRLLSKRRKTNKRRKNNTLVLPKEWEDLQHMAEEEHNSNTCSKKKLTVDFSDIGWGEWIISPKSFKAHYCSGSCPFPLTKKLRPSNHATIQSLVNAVGINPEVPAPCCVPDKLSSITLLYFDENRNVVLKNYPNMTVRKCACR